MEKDSVPCVEAWARHRSGREQLTEDWLFSTKALDLNRVAQPFLQTYGKREFHGFVGFLDLCGFSARTATLPPRGIHDYAIKFLEKVVSDICDCEALVDKTIGDEVMFVLPDFEDDGGTPAYLRILRLLDSLRRTTRTLGAEYPMKLGLAFGEMYLGRVSTRDYAEWTAFGEPVHLAKRVQARTPRTDCLFFGHFAVLTGDGRAERMYDYLLDSVRMLYPSFLIDDIGPVDERGVSTARCASLVLSQEAL